MREMTIKSAVKRATREEIIGVAISQFAQHGYDGVSMRSVALGVGVTQAALYYHFPDKQQLYLSAVKKAFLEQAETLKTIQGRYRSAWEQLEGYIEGLTRLVAAESNYLRLMQWVLLDSDQTRQRMLAEEVFKDTFTTLHALIAELDPHHDAHLVAIMIFGMVLFPFQASVPRQFLPGHTPGQDDPVVLSRHVCDLLRKGLAKGPEKRTAP